MFDKKITFYVLTYNKLNYLKNLINSFFFCNEVVEYEFIIADYGSIDGTREYIYQICNQNDKFKHVFGNRLEYLKKLEEKGLDMNSNLNQKFAMTHKYRNDVLSIAKGKYLFDLGERHQFIRKINFLHEIENDYKFIEGSFDFKIGGFNVRTPTLYSIYKANNTFSDVINTNINTYYVCNKKGYDDFYFWKHQTYLDFGKFVYSYINQFRSKTIIQNGERSHLHDYNDKLIKNNYRKVFVKFPLTLEIPNDFFPKYFLNLNFNNKCFLPILDSDLFKKSFSKINRPITSNDFFLKYGANGVPKLNIMKYLIFDQNIFYYLFKNYANQHEK